MTNKYLKEIQLINGKVDVYSVLLAFNVTCPARQHAIKKLLCAGQRGGKSELTDLEEAMSSVERAIEIQKVLYKKGVKASFISALMKDANDRQLFD